MGKDFVKKEGKIIVFEGCDGVGKHTQALLLEEYLIKRGIDVELISFPRYGEKSSLPVREYLSGNLGNLYGMETLLYALDRYVYITENNVLKRKKNGTWFIFDRYVQSGAVYSAAKHEKKKMKYVEKFFTLEYGIMDLPEPDLTFYLQLSDEVNDKLIDNRRDDSKQDIHEKDKEYMKKVRKLGLKVADTYLNTIINCDASDKIGIRSPEEIHEVIRKSIDLIIDPYGEFQIKP